MVQSELRYFWFLRRYWQFYESEISPLEIHSATVFFCETASLDQLIKIRNGLGLRPSMRYLWGFRFIMATVNDRLLSLGKIYETFSDEGVYKTVMCCVVPTKHHKMLSALGILEKLPQNIMGAMLELPSKELLEVYRKRFGEDEDYKIEKLSIQAEEEADLPTAAALTQIVLPLTGKFEAVLQSFGVNRSFYCTWLLNLLRNNPGVLVLTDSSTVEFLLWADNPEILTCCTLKERAAKLLDLEDFGKLVRYLAKNPKGLPRTKKYLRTEKLPLEIAEGYSRIWPEDRLADFRQVFPYELWINQTNKYRIPPLYRLKWMRGMTAKKVDPKSITRCNINYLFLARNRAVIREIIEHRRERNPLNGLGIGADILDHFFRSGVNVDALTVFTVNSLCSGSKLEKLAGEFRKHESEINENRYPANYHEYNYPSLLSLLPGNPWLIGHLDGNKLLRAADAEKDPVIELLLANLRESLREQEEYQEEMYDEFEDMLNAAPLDVLEELDQKEEYEEECPWKRKVTDKECDEMALLIGGLFGAMVN